MKTENTKVRIKDIAVLAGVSEGTVDRVLHNRGEVSKKSKEAVEKVLKEINYSPNLLARSLASKKHYRFACFIPAYQPGEYWESIETGFDRAAREYLQYNVHLEKVYFNQYDPSSFKKGIAQILQSGPDAVILAPVFPDETLTFTQELKKLEIPFSFIDSMLENPDFTTYYGQNSFQSGYLAAKLLLSSLPENSKILMITTNIISAETHQTKVRNAGFIQYITDNNLIGLEIINIELSSLDESVNMRLLHESFIKHEDIRAAISFNSKVYRFAYYLEAMKMNDIRLIGYDLLQENINYLKSGYISCLLAQRPEKQAYFTVRDMCSKLVLKQQVNKINYMPIDIIMKENIDDYINFNE